MGVDQRARVQEADAQRKRDFLEHHPVNSYWAQHAEDAHKDHPEEREPFHPDNFPGGFEEYDKQTPLGRADAVKAMKAMPMQLFLSMDKDGDEKLDFGEFEAWVSHMYKYGTMSEYTDAYKSVETGERIIFEHADDNQDGKLEPAEFAEHMWDILRPQESAALGREAPIGENSPHSIEQDALDPARTAKRKEKLAKDAQEKAEKEAARAAAKEASK
jgi:hypothetical protein